MLSKIVKWTAIAALIGGVFARSTTGFAVVFEFAVMAASVVVLTQAASLGRYIWMTTFFVVACLFNPVFPVPFSSNIFWATSGVASLFFFCSLGALQTKPKLSIVSITGLLPGSESL